MDQNEIVVGGYYLFHRSVCRVNQIGSKNIYYTQFDIKGKIINIAVCPKVNFVQYALSRVQPKRNVNLGNSIQY